MTANQTFRVKQAIAETQHFLDRELAYVAHLQKADRIAEYRAHLAKLNTMLETGTILS